MHRAYLRCHMVFQNQDTHWKIRKYSGAKSLGKLCSSDSFIFCVFTCFDVIANIKTTKNIKLAQQIDLPNPPRVVIHFRVSLSLMAMVWGKIEFREKLAPYLCLWFLWFFVRIFTILNTNSFTWKKVDKVTQVFFDRIQVSLNPLRSLLCVFFLLDRSCLF